MSGQLLLLALPAFHVGLVTLRSRQSIGSCLLQDPPDARGGNLDVVVAGQVHGDLLGPEVIVLAQVEDLAHDLSSHI